MNTPHPAHLGRREFIQTAAATALVGALHGAAAEDKPRPQTAASRQLTVAGLQMLVSHDLAQNEEAIRSGITAAAEKKADFLLTPEVALTGFGSQFEREPVVAAAARLAEHAKKLRVGLLLGTGYKELEDSARAWVPRKAPQQEEYCYNMVRVYAPDGEFLGSHAKILLSSSLRHPGTVEMKDYIGGTLRTFAWNGLRFGVLICNDLWATPGSTSLPNPYLPALLKQMGAELIFHAVNSGHDPIYRPFHETSQALWARALHVPIVTANAVKSHETPTNCRSGVISPDGEHIHLAPDSGEDHVFTYPLTWS
jgi:predicted amidohydrolase